MSVDTKRFNLYNTEVEFDTYYPSEYTFNTITNPLALSAFKAASERGFHIDKLVVINKINLTDRSDWTSLSAALKHIIDYKWIDCIVLIDISNIYDENKKVLINKLDKCLFLEMNGFRNFNSIYHEYGSQHTSYMLINYTSMNLLKEVIFRNMI